MCCRTTQASPYRAADLAAGCWACPRSRERPGFCGASGEPIVEVTVGGRPCPAGILPAPGRPTFRLWGVRWRGVPMPLRWVLDALGSDAEFAGCGCVDSLKSAAERVVSWPARFWRAVGVGRRSS